MPAGSWNGSTSTRTRRRPRAENILDAVRAVDDWLAASSPVESVIAAAHPVVAKSLSTFIYPHVSRSAGVLMALLTPVLSLTDFDPDTVRHPVPGDDDYEPGSAPEPLICAGIRGTRCTAATGPIVSAWPRA